MHGPRNRTRGRVPKVCASQLAQMGVCEKLVVFEHRYGKRPCRSRSLAQERGRRAHRSFLGQAGANTGPAPGRLAAGGITCLTLVLLRRCMQWWRAAWRYLRGSRP